MILFAFGTLRVSLDLVCLSCSELGLGFCFFLRSMVWNGLGGME